MRISRRHLFPLLAALCLVGVEIAGAVLFSYLAPLGTRWLGDTIASPSDIAVYLSYINQGKDGHILLHNLYAIEPHLPLFHPVWSALALVARLPLSAVILHEGARVIFTLILCASLWLIGRRITESYRDAILFFFLCIAGGGTGWLFSVWLGLTHGGSLRLDAAPDISSEFSVFLTFLGGAHVILSLALLILGLFWTWNTLTSSPAPHPPTSRSSTSLFAGLCLGLLLAIHPYFAPLLVFFVLFALIEGRGLPLRIILRRLGIIGICILPATFIYLPLYQDTVFRTHHLNINQLPLASSGAWLATLLPFITAAIWRIRKKIPLKPTERWVMAWIFSAMLAIILPFPWKRKYTEGLGIACVILTFPAWQAVRDWLMQQAPSARRNLTIIMVCIGAALSPLHLITSTIAWAAHPTTSHYFYQSKDIFVAWKQLREQTTTDDVIVTDDAWLNLWTPSYTGRTIATGHDHETPDYVHKQEIWKELFATNDARRAQDILNELHVTTLLMTSEATAHRLRPLLTTEWKEGHIGSSNTVFIRIDKIINNP